MDRKRKEYLVFLKALFTIGLHRDSKDTTLLSIMTEKRKKEASVFAEYLLEDANRLDELSTYSWESIQSIIQHKERPVAEDEDIFFREYLEKKAEATQ